MSVAPTQPLGKVYTLKKIRSIIARWLKRETQEDLAPELIDDFINLAIQDVAEIISGAGSDDYGKTATLSDAASSVKVGYDNSPAGSYTNSSRTITDTAHGLTSADVGKRIMYGHLPDSQGVWCIATIESITDANNFVVSVALGSDIAGGSLYYAVFSAHSTTNIDLSSYKIQNITRIYDSINKEVIKVGDKEFDNLYRFDEKQSRCYYYKHGQYLYLYKGTSVSSWGTLTMYYNSYPQIFEADNEGEYLDIRDMYVSLYLAKAKQYCLEHLEITPPESLTQTIDNKTKEYRENILREKLQANNKNVSSKAT